jgi:mono/diheme cytochrome c family protein
MRGARRAAGLAAAMLLAAACGDQPAPPPGAKGAPSAPAPSASAPAPAGKAPVEPVVAVPPSRGSADKGKQVWLGQCVACHNPDPTKDGPLGPSVKGASRELLDARVVKGTYPPGYTPKRPSKVMPARPDLASSIPDLAAYLQ